MNGKIHRIILVLLVFNGIILFIISIISYLYFGEEQIQRRMKERICYEVISREGELSEVIEECPLETILLAEKDAEDDQNDFYKIIYYKDLQIQEINKVFKDFRLVWIKKRVDGSVDFAVKSTVFSALWNNYRCGFYYTENDEPMDMWSGNKIQKTEYEDGIAGFAKYWYRTEKITDNWWFYETKIWYVYPTPR